MIVRRTITIETGRLQLGDQIIVHIDGADYTATAINQENDGMLFVLDTCLHRRMSMYEANVDDDGYDKSDIRKYLQEISKTISSDLIVPFENGDKLRLLTSEEVCGKNGKRHFSEGQIEYFKKKKNRLVIGKYADIISWYTSTSYSLNRFDPCKSNCYWGIEFGDLAPIHMKSKEGIRPVFKLRNEMI